ncbi:MAG TPA: 2-phospho-L-lactate transferase [Candidatus Dormibacteraeota bacterium]|nr:2-phospho-L-lactate transferase [Candidatus Dormibacteraeota bacterium]
MKVVVLAGGTGGATLADGIRLAAPEHELTVIANTADDDEFWGLLVSPDIDAVLYRFAGMFNEDSGYGVKDDTFHVLEALARAGEETWFRIGDKDLATHLIRTELVRGGATPTDATLDLAKRFGIEPAVLPMSDDVVRTRFTTDAGELSFQEYFVREHLQPKLQAIHFAGIETARPSPRVEAALRAADVVIIGPSNPLISIEPILQVVGEGLAPERTIAISPIVEGASLKGPTIEMMRALGHSADPLEVARMYADIAQTFVLDSRDRALAAAIEKLDYRVLLADTVMRDGGRALASLVLGHV